MNRVSIRPRVVQIADAGAAVVADHAYILGGEKDGADTPVESVVDIHT